MLQMIVIIIIVLLVLGMATTGDVLIFFKSVVTAVVSVITALLNLIS